MSKSTTEIRQAFLDFFYSKGHQIISSSSLVPENDPTLLFTNAGMNQFKDVFLGLDNRSYRRATTSQRCVRVGGKHNDLENVGYTTRHHTFFEMLGNFSFGDYFKHEAILFAWELLTEKKWFNLPKDKLWVTVYATDDETYDIWAKEVGLPIKQIIRIGDNKGSTYASDNFWQMGNTGPCGPCSEIFYDHGEHIWGGPPGSLEENGDRYTEIWNLVFIQFNRQADGNLLVLPKPSVDTGMGLERIAAILQHVHSNYDIDLFKTLISAVEEVTGSKYPNSKSLRVIADHIRSCAFLISDGVIPSKEGRGYILRRIIRRAIRHGNMLGASDTFFYKLVSPLIINMTGSNENHIKSQQTMIEQVLRNEEEQFARTLKRGLMLLDNELAKLTNDTLDGEIAFRLYDTYGFPLDLTADICRERNLHVDKSGFNLEMEAQRKRARTSSGFSINYNNLLSVNKTTRFFGYEYLEHQGCITALFRDGQPVDTIFQGEEAVVVLDETPFYGESGGQVGDKGILKAASMIFKVADTQKYGKIFFHHGKLSYGVLQLGMKVIAQVDSVRRKRICLNHSAIHLLHAALLQILSKHIEQKGSLVNDHHLRFDFSYNKDIKLEQIHWIEKLVNEQIRRNLPIKTDILKLEDARKKGVVKLFNEKYDSHVRILSIGDFSTELCGGTHTSRTGDIGLFHIISEFSTAAGIRRIEALTAEEALESLHQKNDIVKYIAKLVKGDSQTLIDKIRVMQERYQQLKKDLKQLKNQQAIQKSTFLSSKVRDINGVQVLVSQLNSSEPEILRTIVDNLKNQLESAVIILASVLNGKINLIAGVTKDLINLVKANDIIAYLVKQVNGKGGGHPEMAQANGKNISALPAALSSIDAILVEKFK
ncbi:Alanine--tRNA ligase [Candidatus Gullanella endobia]|uniref:Alanine--tRNA ligase n=1 Tax=Candidatus Gullanella endobia TaxID=1070130 RepID=A0A143WR18_9ENTR|nr:alanine--tRNA ligase [Candidatus Gullanella endobia]CUX96061.1 Alanine--tRNA ligase [Candidatus Gullanella endobia]